MRTWMLIAIGSALGGVSRHVLGTWVVQRVGQGFPWGTLAVNALGSFIIGICAAWAMSVQRDTAAFVRDFAMIGFLGGFTTFSAFSLQTLQLLRDGKIGFALANVAGSVVVCLLAVWLGLVFALRNQ